MIGYNFGLNYSGAPLLGPFTMVWFTLALSVMFGWLTIKAGSICPVVIAHGVVNGMAAFGVLFVKGSPEPLLGPTSVEVIDSLGLIITAAVILIRPRALEPNSKTNLQISRL